MVMPPVMERERRRAVLCLRWLTNNAHFCADNLLDIGGEEQALHFRFAGVWWRREFSVMANTTCETHACIIHKCMHTTVSTCIRSCLALRNICIVYRIIFVTTCNENNIQKWWYQVLWISHVPYWRWSQWQQWWLWTKDADWRKSQANRDGVDERSTRVELQRSVLKFKTFKISVECKTLKSLVIENITTYFIENVNHRVAIHYVHQTWIQ